MEKDDNTAWKGPMVPVKCIISMHVDASKRSECLHPCDENIALAKYWKILQKEMWVSKPCELPSDIIAAIRTLLRVAERRYKKDGEPSWGSAFDTKKKYDKP